MKNALLRVAVLAMALTLVFSVLTVSAANQTIPKGTPTIDGVEESMWNNASAKIPITMTWTGDEDTNASGYARVMWDDKFLYCIGVIKDSTPTTGLKDNVSPWFTDSFEVFLDEENKGTGDIPIAQFRVDTKGKFTGMLQHVSKDEAGMREEYKDTKFAVKTNATGYIVEIAIPWTRISAKANTTIGLAFQINDEKDNSGYQDGTITSAVAGSIWKCQNYSDFILSSDTVSDGKSNNNSTVGESKNNSSKNQSSNQSTVGSNIADNKTQTNNTQSDADTNDITTDTSNDSITNQDDNESGESSGNTPILDGDDSGLSPLMIALGVVIIVCTLAIIGVLVYVIISNSKNKKSSVTTNKEDKNE